MLPLGMKQLTVLIEDILSSQIRMLETELYNIMLETALPRLILTRMPITNFVVFKRQLFLWTIRLQFKLMKSHLKKFQRIF